VTLGLGKRSNGRRAWTRPSDFELWTRDLHRAEEERKDHLRDALIEAGESKGYVNPKTGEVLDPSAPKPTERDSVNDELRRQYRAGKEAADRLLRRGRGETS
jgi:hypothetical protein